MNRIKEIVEEKSNGAASFKYDFNNRRLIIFWFNSTKEDRRKLVNEIRTYIDRAGLWSSIINISCFW